MSTDALPEAWLTGYDEARKRLASHLRQLAHEIEHEDHNHMASSATGWAAEMAQHFTEVAMHADRLRSLAFNRRTRLNRAGIVTDAEGDT